MSILNILLFTALLVCTHAHQSAELFDAFEEFIGGLLQPSSVMASGSSSALATDCVGRTSFMTLRGIENNIEFLYGVSSKVAQVNTTQIVGYPTNIIVESLSIQKSVVSASTVFRMNHGTSSPTTPLQVDFWIYFDDDLKISEYDLAVRNLGKAFSFLSSVLSEQISTEIIVGNSTDAVSAKMAVDVCTAVTEYCTGANQQYDSYNSCFESLGKNVTIDNLDQSVCR
ncbi:uncharacterized protein EV420DRAFT_1642281 [Desarmillaria tabescens]|uniref:Uncharacterized protein n=1 Tax=Armillaria tabescens TaxID=1929756 RepID=A0AA39KGH2_ARMTA|nr:uncharacterized protein EV420DRAFT_1642281 [Desarmillaria tabescens]KAK0459309.1 hypothetical protein EV420DRAFT_1642281 [Desarmillaria tabescens]